MKNIPNLFTLLNLVFGCLAIVFVLHNGIMINITSDGTQLLDIPQKIWMASLFIGLAAVVDFLDGFVARLFRASSEIGKQLDSLADLVSFGVAPGMIFFEFLKLSLSQDAEGIDASIIWLLPAFILPCAAAWRLARFNLDPTQTDYFRGMPVPANGIFAASLPLIYWNVNQDWVPELLLNRWVLYGLIFLLSWLMVSRLPLMSFKFKDFSFKANLPRYLVIIVAVIAVIFLQWLAPPVIVLAYVLLSLVFKSRIT